MSFQPDPHLRAGAASTDKKGEISLNRHRNQLGIKCSIKASEGFLYCLEKAFMFIPKPATYIAYEQTASITFSRVSGAVSALSTFDITVVMKNGNGSTQFSNISREDLKALETFFRLKGLRVKNEIDEDANLLKAALREEADDSEEEVVGQTADRGSADEDEESVDEDFRADSDSDVAEEFDSDPDTTDSEDAESGVDDEAGGNDDDDNDDDDDAEEEEEERPKKKKKTG